MGCGHVGILVCLGNEDLGNAVGEGGQFEGLGSMRPPTRHCFARTSDGTTDRRGIGDHKNRKRLTRSGLSAGNTGTSKGSSLTEWINLPR
jgi:hypothetical protein